MLAYRSSPVGRSLDNEHEVWIAITKWRQGSCSLPRDFVALLGVHLTVEDSTEARLNLTYCKLPTHAVIAFRNEHDAVTGGCAIFVTLVTGILPGE